MSSKTFEGIRFAAYPGDHEPAHIHGRTAGVEVIFDLLSSGRAQRSRRIDAIRPSNAKRSDVRRVLAVANRHYDDLLALWEDMRHE